MKIYTLTLLPKSGLPVKIVLPWNIVLSSQCQIFIKHFMKSRLQKRMFKKIFKSHMIFKIFFQNYSLSIINANWSLAKRLRSRKWKLCESSDFSHLLGMGWLEIVGGGNSFSRVKTPSFRHFLLHKLSDLHLQTW